MIVVPDQYPMKCRVRIKYYDDDFQSREHLEALLRDKMDCEIVETKILDCNEISNKVELENFVSNKEEFLLYLQNQFNIDEERASRIHLIHEKELGRLNVANNMTKNYWKMEKLEFKNILCYKKNSVCLSRKWRKRITCGI